MHSNVNTLKLSNFLKAGLYSALAATLLAIIVWQVMINTVLKDNGQTYPEISPISIALSSIILTLLGSVIYYFLSKKFENATRVWIFISIAFTILYTVLTSISPLHPQMEILTAALHLAVALSVLYLLPRLLKQMK